MSQIASRACRPSVGLWLFRGNVPHRLTIISLHVRIIAQSRSSRYQGSGGFIDRQTFAAHVMVLDGSTQVRMPQLFVLLIGSSEKH
eukprot:53426-Eustigmatos_ZCMA.PRE.1